MKKYTLKHIHADVGMFNGSLYFVVDNRLFRVGVGTPHFNDYNEWRLDEFDLSVNPYNPEDNAVELAPFKFDDIEIDENDLRMLDFGSRGFEDNHTPTDEECKKLATEFPDIDTYLAGTLYKDKKGMSFYQEEGDKWLHPEDIEKIEKTSFQKVFYAILQRFAKGYITSEDEGIKLNF